ncbi:hypothetical protein FB567DRAFT_251588 [Paraphoma chrysanthemicola]|uniref:chitinase n=1 Tax=Paraphoma chrysanthemicola TaxID=798071 RepID=A0A8K0VRC7_9PLEO|nr:hypothetical protein FB567DRAFT_251588 [Paraphoma chrysanthemicola]
MGLAYYGRTYKLADASCGRMGCGFKGPGAAGECTAFEGVLSNREIQAMIKKDGLTPYFNETAMVKYVTYAGNSWVGYDDAETLALKEGFANSLCLGGLMIWSIDFDAGTGAQLPGDSGNDKDLVWVSPDIWKQPNPQVYCQFPCTVVLPPYQGVTATTAYPPVTVTSSGYTTTVTRPPVTISVWWISTLVIGPSSSGDVPKTVTSGVTLLTTTTWPAFTTTDSTGRLIYTSATETRRPPPPYITSAVPSITFISGLPPRPTTTPYPTPCSKLPGLCDPGEEENEDPEDDGDGDGDFKGEDCDSGGCGSSCGGCKAGLLCNLCIGFKCLGCIGLDCVSCKGPLCNICIGANCSGCKGPKCATCKGKDCVSCTKGKCGSPTCTDLQCQPGTDPDPDEEEEEEEDDGKCYWRRDTMDNPWGWDNDDGGGGRIPGNGGGSTTQPGGGSPTAPGGGGGSTPKPSTPVIQKPDFSNPSSNTNKCYDNGQMATREHMVQAAESFCKTYDGVTFGSNSYQAALVGFGWQEVHKSGLNILVRLEAKNNCEWLMTKDECNKQFVALIDGCDQEGIIDKQGGVRENNCLMWRIDPEQNPDVQAPAPPPQPKPSDPPAPEQPKTPEIKEGNRPKFDIYTWSLYMGSGGPGAGSWLFGRQAISYYGEYKVCLASYGWSEDDTVTTTDMPDDIKGITKVFGKTCDYSNGGLAERIDYDKAKVGDVVGYLNCEGWATSKCYKEDLDFTCFGTGMFLRATCYW